MNVYLMYVLIIILTVIFFLMFKDKTKALKLTGILTISSSLLLITLILIIKIILTNSITSINISSVTNYIFMEFVTTSLLLFILGLLEIIISKHISSKRKVEKNNPISL